MTISELQKKTIKTYVFFRIFVLVLLVSFGLAVVNVITNCSLIGDTVLLFFILVILIGLAFIISLSFKLIDISEGKKINFSSPSKLFLTAIFIILGFYLTLFLSGLFCKVKILS